MITNWDWCSRKCVAEQKHLSRIHGRMRSDISGLWYSTEWKMTEYVAGYEVFDVPE